MNEIPDEAKPAVGRLIAKIGELERQANKLRSTVNDILVHGFDAEPLYQIVDPDEVAAAAPTKAFTVKPDQFFNKPFSTCVREILEARKEREMGPAEPRELYELLRQGGYAFETRNDADAFRAMMISIGKNTATFVRVPGGQVGLAEWYGPSVRRRVRLSSVAPATVAGGPTTISDAAAEGEDAAQAPDAEGGDL